MPSSTGRGEDGYTPNRTICARPPTPTAHLSRARNRRYTGDPRSYFRPYAEMIIRISPSLYAWQCRGRRWAWSTYQPILRDRAGEGRRGRSETAVHGVRGRGGKRDRHGPPVVRARTGHALIDAWQWIQQVLRCAAVTPREAEILGLVAEGLSNAGVTARLFLSPAHRGGPRRQPLPQDRAHDTSRAHRVRGTRAGHNQAPGPCRPRDRHGPIPSPFQAATEPRNVRHRRSRRARTARHQPSRRRVLVASQTPHRGPPPSRSRRP